LAESIRAQFPDVQALVGVATAGIAIGALLADELNLSYAYCRPEPKGHGLKKQLEGRLDKNQKIVVVEDLISTGGSSLKVVKYLRSEGYEVMGLAAIFTYGFEIAENAFREANCPYIALSNYSSLIEAAIQSGYVSEEQSGRLAVWRQDPANWS
jgi:orotate phosphoribosyltransferase